jgi:alkanesulfonate monooxygenase SsuD/methylene tetrahydromethanopterin reductase-like flavin-dependent oxidoreductase (luciferase family)
VKFGIQVNCYRTTWNEIRASVEAMEAGGWSSVWFADHFLPPTGNSKDEPLPAFEGMTLLAGVAGMTDRLELGHLVLGNTYRNPALVAKMAATLDQVSGGRFTLALGTGWFEREHRAYGWEFPSMRERQDRLEEACALIRALFAGPGPVDFAGRYYRLEKAFLSPPCVQQPRVPILIGGTGERRTLRTLARYGDVFNLDGWAGGGMALDYYRHKIDVLERHCEDAGRDPAQIRRTLLMPVRITDDRDAAERFVKALGPGTVAGPLDYVLHRIAEFADAGVDEVMFGAIRTGDVETIHRFDQQVVAGFTSSKRPATSR